MTQPHPQHDPAQPVEVVDDFDAFWRAHTAQRPQVRILGQLIPVPFDMPLWAEQAVSAGGVESMEQVHKLIDAIYGPDTLAGWIDRGVGLHQLKILLAWAVLRVQGREVTFAQAVTEADRMDAEQAAAKAAAAERNARISQATDPDVRAALAAHEEAVLDAGKALSAGGGQPWRPTSPASTASTAPSSPGSAYAGSGFYSVG